jgi:hypothetical protein
MAIKENKSVQDVDAAALGKLLRSRGAYLESRLKTLDDLNKTKEPD